MLTTDFFTQLFSSAGYYSLFALAIVLIYRTNKVLLFCVGELGALASFIAYSTNDWLNTQSVPFSGLIGVVVAVAIITLISILLLWIIEQMGTTGSHFIGTMITIAFSIVLQGIMSVIWQGEIYRYTVTPLFFNLGDARISGLAIIVGTIGLLLAIGTVMLLKKSRIGYDMQAIADNRTLSTLRGIPVQQRILLIGALVGILSATAGILGASLTSISLENASLSVNAIIAAIIGGLTSPIGAIAGAIVLAIVENITTVFLDSRYATLTPIVLLGIFLVFRPYGLSGKSEHIQRV